MELLISISFLMQLGKGFFLLTDQGMGVTNVYSPEGERIDVNHEFMYDGEHVDELLESVGKGGITLIRNEGNEELTLTTQEGTHTLGNYCGYLEELTASDLELIKDANANLRN